MSKSNLAVIGADPEAFVRNGFGISHCIDMLGGSKENPRVVVSGAVQEDNVLFEFNVDPTDDPKQFLHNIRNVLAQGTDILIPFGLRIVPKVSSHIYDDMSDFPEKAFEFGCTPDYNAFTGEQNPRPSAENLMLRTAGGHVHIGWSHLHTVTEQDQRNVMMMCDYLLGLPSLLEDTDSRRRELYGKAGACRLKSYGAEYRTLSNYWIWDDALVGIVHGRAQRAYELAMQGQLAVLQAIIPQEDVQRIINTNNIAEAKAALEVISHATK